MDSYCCILEMVIYKMEIHGENMSHSKGGCYLELVLLMPSGLELSQFLY